jgi:hypothetical protein
MRLALALAATLVFSASIALADQAPPSDQAQSGQAAAPSDQHKKPHDARNPAPPDPYGPHLTRTIFPSYQNDQDTEADCYYVSGDLHCDRIRRPHEPKK